MKPLFASISPRVFLAFGLIALPVSPIRGADEVPAVEDGPEVTLRARLNPGKTYTVRQVMDSEMSLPLEGAGKALTTLEYRMKLAVGAADADGSKTVGVSMHGFKMKMEMGATTMEYDSSDPTKQNPLLKGMMGQMAEKTFEARFDKNDTLIEAPKDAEKPAAAAPSMMGMTLGESEVRQIMGSLVDHGFPDKAVKPGDKWMHKVNSAISQMGSFAMEMEYEYLGEADCEGHSCAKLRVKGRKAEAEAKAPAIMNIAKADMNGVILFDNKEGIARQTEMSMDMTMSTGGAELPVKSKVTSSLVEIGEAE